MKKLSNNLYNIITYDISGNIESTNIYSNNSNIKIIKQNINFIYVLTFSIGTLRIRKQIKQITKPIYFEYQDGSGTVKIIDASNGTFRCVDKDNNLITNNT